MDLKAKPFNLNDSQIKWVEETLGGMTFEEKIGQLFCIVGLSEDENFMQPIIENFKPGGIMYRDFESEKAHAIHKFLQENSKIPMLTAANLESGGSGIASDGTDFGKNMQVAATDNLKMAYELGRICGIEGNAVGINWAFAPVIDIDMNFRNPITNLRTFGDDPERVLAMGREYMRGVHTVDMAVSIKHFPGDGVDERDQHLIASVNSLSADEWDKTYGKIYKGLIDDGAETVMVGHIMQPAYERLFDSNVADKDILPASLSKNLLNKLLREKLGFNGLIVTDATLMAGFTCYMPREKSVPYSIEAGCDMFLFTKDLQEDYKFMMEGYKNGILSDKRLNEAVTRILALKCTLNLIGKDKKDIVPPAENLKVVGCKEHIDLALKCADEAITLVKDTQNNLPLRPEKTKRMLLVPLLMGASAFGGSVFNLDYLVEKLKAEGFDVDVMDTSKMSMMDLMKPTSDFLSKYDCALYAACLNTASNNTVVRINWTPPMGIEIPWFVNEVPTVFVSFANPYHLLDVPMVKTYINAYGHAPHMIDKTVEKIVGKSEFKGKSPVDAFCGTWDTRF